MPSVPEAVLEKERKHFIKVKVKEWIQILKTVSVEPAALCLMTSTLMTYLLFQNLFIENVCRVGRNNSEEVCLEIISVNDTFANEEKEIQKIVAKQKIYRSILDYTFPILFVIFMGPWSDFYGRKLPLIISSFGIMLSAVVTMICSMYYEVMDPLLLNLISVIPRVLTGGEVAFAMAAYSYISDQSDHRLRTVRTGMMNAGIQIGVPIGFSLAGLSVKHKLSYAWGFGISAIISCIGFIFILATVKNQTKDVKESEKKLECGESVAENEKNPSCWTIVNPKNNFYKVIALPFKKRVKNTRLKIWLLLLVFVCTTAPIHGEFQVMYLFVRERLEWDIVKYGDFSTYNFFIATLGVALSMGILSKWLRLGDPLVGFISGISQLGGCIIYVTAINSLMMYLASTVDMMNGTMIVIARSMLSKTVAPDEIGKLFSLMAILESFIPLAINPLYTSVYMWTVDIFSGYVIILSAVFTIPPQLIYLWFMWENKKKSKKKSNEKNGKVFEIEK